MAPPMMAPILILLGDLAPVVIAGAAELDDAEEDVIEDEAGKMAEVPKEAVRG